MPYENIEGTTQKLATAGQGVQNVHMMFQSLLDRRQRRNEARGQMMTQFIQPSLEGYQERETEKLRQEGATKLEQERERLFQSRYLNEDYLAATNEPRKGILADTELIDYFMTHPDAYAVWKEMAKLKQSTSHYSTSAADQAEADRLREVSPESYIQDKHKNFLASIALSDGTPDPAKNNAANFKKYLELWIPKDLAGNRFDKNPEAYAEIKNDLDRMVESFYAPAQAPDAANAVSGKELGDMRTKLLELLQQAPQGVAGDNSASMIQQALGSVEAAIKSPEEETRSQLRSAIDTLESMLKKYSAIRREKNQQTLEKARGHIPGGLQGPWVE